MKQGAIYFEEPGSKLDIVGRQTINPVDVGCGS
jgi:hypothetical protein